MSSPYLQQLKNCRRIGLFDSGVGGLTVLDKLKRFSSTELANGNQPQEFIYLGDSARCPYGDRPSSELLTFIREIVAWLLSQHVDGIVVACNTSASIALQTTRHFCQVPMFDLIIPTAQYVGKLGHKVGIMATNATVKTQAFSKAIHKVNPELEVVEIACPDLVPIIERGEIFHDSTIAVLKKYAQKLIRENVEVLIWGCTHFPFLNEPFKQLVEDKLMIIDPAEILLDFEENKRYDASLKTGSNNHQAVYVTGDPFQFARTANICLGYSLDTVIGITVEELGASVPIAHRQIQERDSIDNIQIVPAL